MGFWTGPTCLVHGLLRGRALVLCRWASLRRCCWWECIYCWSWRFKCSRVCLCRFGLERRRRSLSQGCKETEPLSAGWYTGCRLGLACGCLSQRLSFGRLAGWACWQVGWPRLPCLHGLCLLQRYGVHCCDCWARAAVGRAGGSNAVEFASWVRAEDASWKVGVSSAHIVGQHVHGNGGRVSNALYDVGTAGSFRRRMLLGCLSVQSGHG